MGRSDTENAEAHNAEAHNAELAAPSVLQTSGTSTPDTDDDLVSVLVDTIDALQAGQTMRSLARDHRRQIHPSARAVLDRIGTQLVSAANTKLVAKRAKRAGGAP